MIFPTIICLFAFINFSYQLDPEQIWRGLDSITEISKILYNPDESLLENLEDNKLDELAHYYVPDCVFGADHIGFFVYTRKNLDGTRVTTKSLDIPVMNNTKTFFVIHGFVSAANDTSFSNLVQTLLSTYDINVISVDWKDAACSEGFVLSDLISYLSAARNTQKVGEIVASFIEKLHQEHAVDYDDVVVAGHSLGSHVAGFAGKASQKYGSKKYSEIIGMDPAGVAFRQKNCEQRLCKTDANFVNVFHTTASFGLAKNLGHVDFYFNGALTQPGCLEVTCRHYRAVHYVMESIQNNKCFLGTPYDLNSRTHMPESQCDKSTCTFANIYSYTYPPRGSFYVKTEEYPSVCKVPPNGM